MPGTPRQENTVRELCPGFGHEFPRTRATHSGATRATTLADRILVQSRGVIMA